MLRSTRKEPHGRVHRHPLPRWVLLGLRQRLPPGGGQLHQERLVGLGAGGRPHRRRQRLRHRLRPLQPLRGGLRPGPGAGPQRPPPLHRVEPHRARGGPVGHGGGGPLPAGDGVAAPPRPDALRHPPPLHQPPLVPRPRRLAEPAGAGAHRPLRRVHRQGTGRPGALLAHHQRADGRCRRRPTSSATGPPQHQDMAEAHGRVPAPAPGPRQDVPGRQGGDDPRAAGGDRAEPALLRAQGPRVRRGTAPRARWPTPCSTSTS